MHVLFCVKLFSVLEGKEYNGWYEGNVCVIEEENCKSVLPHVRGNVIYVPTGLF